MEIKTRMAVRLKSGKYPGAVGTVQEVRDTGFVRVRIEGVHEGVAVDDVVTVRESALEVIHGG